MTFRRGAALAVLFLILGSALTRFRGRTAPPSGVNKRALFAASIALAAGATSAFGPRSYAYGFDENAVLRPIVGAIRGLMTTNDTAPDVAFEQAPRTFRIDGRPRTRLAAARPFKNAILVHFESCRWRTFSPFDGPEAALPELGRLAKNGSVFRCRVPIPHSSKATFAMLTGLYPAPGVEIAEAVFSPPTTLVREIVRSGRSSFACSAQSLEFEGLGAMLEGIGVDRAFGPGEIARFADPSANATSSFGEDDRTLARAAPQLLGAKDRPFFCFLLTASAHHPYRYPGKTDLSDASFASYRAALAHADRELAGLLDGFDRLGLLEDTLVVVVGDHGESFGEHGTFIHNSSLHEEETLVPLVFWSKDGRMRSPGIGDARQIDVMPTIADSLGVFDSEAMVQGVSLLRDAAPPCFLATFFDDGDAGLALSDRTYVYERTTGVVKKIACGPDGREGPASVVDEEEAAPLRRRIGAFLESTRRFIGNERR